MVNYKSAKIYKIINDIDNEIYVGSTCESLCRRMGRHKASCNSTAACYKHWNNIGWETVAIVLVENYPCENKEELHARERYWIEQIGTLNRNLPGRTAKERYEANKDTINDYNNVRYNEKKELILEQKKTYYSTNKQDIIEKKKEYYESNKDIIRQKYKEYYEKNKERINARRRIMSE